MKPLHAKFVDSLSVMLDSVWESIDKGDEKWYTASALKFCADVMYMLGNWADDKQIREELIKPVNSKRMRMMLDFNAHPTNDDK